VTSLVEDDTNYTVSAWVRHDGAANDGIRLAARVTCATPPVGHNEFPWLQDNQDIAPNTWTQLSGTLEIPASCGPQEIQIYFEGDTDTGSNVYIDEVKVLPLIGGGGGSNLLANGDFESGDTAPWHNFGSGSSLSATTAQAHEGTNSMLVTGLPSTGGYAAYDVTTLVEDDTNYTVSAWVRHDGAANDGIRLAARVTCATPPVGHNEFPWLQDNQDIAPDTWTQLSGTLEIPASCGPQEIQIYFEGDTDQASNVYIDEVSVTAL
jgi:endo-1,4-beta-xylanase